MKSRSITVLLSLIIMTGCGAKPIDRTSIEGAAKGLLTAINDRGETVAGLFYRGAPYFNGSFYTGSDIPTALRKDLSGTQELRETNRFRSAHESEIITVHELMGSAKGKYLITAWLKMRGIWTVLLMVRADSPSAPDLSSSIRAYEAAVNRHDVAALIDGFFTDDPWYINGTNTIHGRTIVKQGLAFTAEPTFTLRMRNTHAFTTGDNCIIDIGEMENPGGYITTFRYITIWRKTQEGLRIAGSFDY